MPATETVNLLINAGIAGVFAVFAIVTLKAFLVFLEGERDSRALTMQHATESMTSIATQMTNLAVQIASLGSVIQILVDKETDHARETSRKLDALSQATQPRQNQERRSPNR